MAAFNGWQIAAGACFFGGIALTAVTGNFLFFLVGIVAAIPLGFKGDPRQQKEAV